MKDRILVVADLLMGAAYADARLEGEEKAAVRRLLREVLGAPALPIDVDFRIDEFRPEAFDLGEAGAAFVDDPPELKRRLLELLAAVHGADREYDHLEDEYLRRVGGAIGLPDDRYRDLLTTVVEEIDLAEDLAQVRFGGGAGRSPA
jgi:uncharacterized tellurite resistance protein B-like protein